MTRSILVKLAVLLLVLMYAPAGLGGARPASAAGTLHVATDGSDTSGDGTEARPWQTIQQAAGEAVPGDTVLVHPGTYTDAVEVYDMAGTEAEPITFKADGPDVVIDAVGRPETWLQAFYGRDLAGTVVLVGVPTPEMKLELPLLDVFGRGGSLKSSWYGDCLPSRDFPMLVDLYRQGRLDLDAFVTEEIGIGDVEAAFDKMHGGDVLRSVVIL